MIELLMVLAIMATLAVLAFPAAQGVLTRAQMMRTVNNARQLYIASQACALDAAQGGGQGEIGWPADINRFSKDRDGITPAPAITKPTDYIRILIANHYLNVDDLEILSAPGIPEWPSDKKDKGLTALTETYNSFKLGNVGEGDSVKAIFLASKNWTWGAPLNPDEHPYGNKGFVVFRMGGNGSAYRNSQAEAVDGSIGTEPDASPHFFGGEPENR